MAACVISQIVEIIKHNSQENGELTETFKYELESYHEDNKQPFLDLLVEGSNDTLNQIVNLGIKENFIPKARRQEFIEEAKSQKIETVEEYLGGEGFQSGSSPIVSKMSGLFKGKNFTGRGNGNNMNLDNAINVSHPHDNTSEEEEKGKMSQQEILNLRAAQKNLYEEVPADKIPLRDSVFVCNLLLERFIDSGAQDFIIETQKTAGKIYHKVLYKLNGNYITQIKTGLNTPEDTSEGGDNSFFSSLRAAIGNKAGINVDNKRTTQDASFTFDYKGKNQTFRLNTLPARTSSEHLFPRYCMRLTSEGDSIKLSNIKLLPHMKKFLENMALSKTGGMRILTGPTGSGKSTTIYGVLNEIDKTKNAVLSIENPIESPVEGVSQTQLDATIKKDKSLVYTIPEFIKAAMRQSPDVLFVGEMRLLEDVTGSIELAQKGTKLITTYHTNSATATIIAMKDLGISNTSIAGGIEEITAQRLVQTLCPHCSSPLEGKDKFIRRFKNEMNYSTVKLQNKLKEIFESFTDSMYGDKEYLTLEIVKRLSYLGKTQLDEISNRLDDRLSEVYDCKNRNEIENKILELLDGYPIHEEKKFVNKLIESEDLRSVNHDGCDKCTGGYKAIGGSKSSRILIAEALEIDSTFSSLIQNDKLSVAELDNLLSERGFITMKQYGYMLALKGVVDFKDVDLVVGN